MSEKREAPTPKRLEKARAEGRVPHSRLFVASASVLSGLTAALGLRERLAVKLQALSAQLWSSWEVPPEVALRQAALLLVEASSVALAALAGAVMAGVVASGANFTTDVLRPRFERLDPFAQLKRMFGWDGLAALGKGLVLGAVLLGATWAAAPPWLAAWRASVAGPPELAGVGLLEMLWRGACWATAVAGLDVLLARARWLRDHRMSSDEVRREHRENEGDPTHRALRQRLHRQLASTGPRRGVEAASVVVLNPTRIAVALRYDEGECDAPYVVAKGMGPHAAALRAQARALGVPLVPHLALARGLWGCALGEAIPEELYRAAAAVLSAVASTPESSMRQAP